MEMVVILNMKPLKMEVIIVQHQQKATVLLKLLIF